MVSDEVLDHGSVYSLLIISGLDLPSLSKDMLNSRLLSIPGCDIGGCYGFLQLLTL